MDVKTAIDVQRMRTALAVCSSSAHSGRSSVLVAIFVMEFASVVPHQQTLDKEDLHANLNLKLS